MATGIYVERQGDGRNPVLLLHGLGCNGAVWDDLVPLLRSAGFSAIVPDFAGHGRSDWTSAYNIDRHAAAIADMLEPGQAVRIIGHSMGATVGLALASERFAVEVSSLFSIGLKILWSQDEMDRMGALRPVRHFATRNEAADRFLRVNGLSGLIDPDHRCVDAGLVAEAEGIRLAADPLAACVVREPVAELLETGLASGLSLRLSCGSEDALLDVANMRTWDADAVVFDGFGHNVHLEAKLLLDAFVAHNSDTAGNPV